MFLFITACATHEVHQGKRLKTRIVHSLRIKRRNENTESQGSLK